MATLLLVHADVSRLFYEFAAPFGILVVMGSRMTPPPPARVPGARDIHETTTHILYPCPDSTRQLIFRLVCQLLGKLSLNSA